MKSFFHVMPRCAIVAVVASVLAQSSVRGQAAPGQAAPGRETKADPAKQAQELASHRAGTTSAIALAKSNDLTGAEKALVALNKAKPDSAAWHIETAQRLMQIAERLARDARPAGIQGLATSALQHLNKADTLAKDARTRSSAKVLIGFIQERYLANRTGALSAYQAAVQISPNSTRAKEALNRLQKTDDILRSRGQGGGR